ncbi:unnamed protein product [Rangifer tarandus platyrhynchus]|uniref:Uncharacterized protein n=1 Tax=Rangifer tarandus platyrhynchus TaxID=3082113 RepID=A0ABN9A0G9_RANTA|nr:unnamed protein product [Rangifer tarandus platyrhynchus]
MQGAWVPSLVRKLRSHMLCGQKKKKQQPGVSEKDSNWLSSGHILFLVSGPENTARDWSSLNSCLPVCFFCRGERLGCYKWSSRQHLWWVEGGEEQFPKGQRQGWAVRASRCFLPPKPSVFRSKTTDGERLS